MASDARKSPAPIPGSISSPNPVIATVGILLLLIVGLLVWWFQGEPQLNMTDERVFTTVDALFTALTAKDRVRLEECEQRLKGYRDHGQISAAVAASLNAIVQQARDGKWEPAARRLYEFIRGQRGIKNP